MTSYPTEKRILNDVAGIDNWYWPEHDTELFMGPANDWVNSHRFKYFNFLTGNDVCIQAGGACGMYPKLLSRHFNTVSTFEPHPENFYFLNKNCYESNIIKINGALGSAPGFVDVFKDEGTNQGEFRVKQNQSARIPTFYIDYFNFDACDFIQLDVEGYELNVIEGGIKTIQRHKPVISCEYNLHSDLHKLESRLGELDYVKVDISVSDHIFAHKTKVVLSNG